MFKPTDDDAHAQAWGGMTPRAWQEVALPIAMKALDEGRKGVVRAATGSGKSILQAEVIAQALATLGPDERIVVSVPTQSLVRQLAATISRRVGEAEVGRYYQYEKQVGPQIIVTCHASMASNTAPECLACGDVTSGASREMEGVTCGDCGAPMHMPDPKGLASDLPHGVTVALWVADECHKTECPTVHAWHQWTRPARQIGFTATPWRGLDSERLALWDEVLHDYGPVDAIRDGVILAPTIVGWDGESDDKDRVCLEMILAHLARHDGPGAVSASDVPDAESFAAQLTAAGVPASAISYRDSTSRRDLLLEQLRTGELRALVYCSLLSEGVDLPWLEWLCMRRAVKSRVRLPQEVGRVLRVCEGKAGAFVLDPFDIFGTLSLDYAAMLGWEEELDELDQAAVDAISEIEGGERGGVAKPWRQVREPCIRWLREAVMQARLLGWIKMRVDSTSWRPLEMTAGQVTVIRKAMRWPRLRAATDNLHEATRAMFRRVITAALAERIDRGTASDLIELLMVIDDRGRMPGGAR